MNLLKQLDPWVSEELYKRELQRKTGGSMSWPVAAGQNGSDKKPPRREDNESTHTQSPGLRGPPQNTRYVRGILKSIWKQKER